MKPLSSRTVRFLLPLVLLAALGLFESRWRPAALVGSVPTAAAEWIWGEGLSVEDGWVSFFVYRDFEIEAVPDTAVLLAVADEGYWAFVNRHAVGSGGYRPDAPLDSYEVARFLRPGTNRVLFQLRSRRGVGGLLARLDLGSVGSVVTDGGWRTSRRYEPALQTSGFVAEDEGGVKVWGPPPLGAWKPSSEVRRLPVLRKQTLGAEATEVVRFRALGDPQWTRGSPDRRSREPLGRWVSFDLGRPVAGYVNVAFADRSGARGLIYLGVERATGPDTADPATFLASPPGRGSWTDPRPREFRFVTVLALADIAGLSVFETAPQWSAERESGRRRSRLAFELEPPQSTATVEDEFWRELKRVTGLTGREAFESVPGR